MNAGALVLGEGLAGRRPIGRRWSATDLAACLATGVIAALIVAYFHDRFWWAPDEGAYAWVADRLANGAVLGRDVQDPHAGYIHFLNAAAMELFGRDFLSLRYPLCVATIAQAVIVFILLRQMSVAIAIVGGVAMASLTFVQFINPTANWYALFLTVVIAALVAAGAGRSRAGLVAIGLAIGMLFLFRQLSGVFVAMGVVAFLIMPAPDAPLDRRRVVIAPLIAAVAGLGLAAYLAAKADLASFLLYGAFPLAVLIAVALKTRLPDRDAIGMMAFMLLGACLGALPLTLYHLAHGTLGMWWQDSIASAVSLTELDFFGQASYAKLVALGMHAFTTGPVGIANGLFWLIVLFAPVILGVAILARLLRGESVHPLAFIGLFYALVSIHYAIPIYALYSVGLALVGLLALSPPRLPRIVASMTALFAVVVGLVWQAGQPLERGLAGTMRGDRIALDALGPAGATVRIAAADCATYDDVLGFIDAKSAPSDTVLALPMGPEFYFLSRRNPPVPYAIAPLGLRTNGDFAYAIERISANPPAVLIFEPGDKYVTPRVQALMDSLRPAYRHCRTVGPFELHARIC
jgi:hypothetical protein